MPPPLSDYSDFYSSDSEADCRIVPKTQKTAPAQAPPPTRTVAAPSTPRPKAKPKRKHFPVVENSLKKRKRSNLLSGLDLNNIIASSGEMSRPTIEGSASPPIPPSTYKTRACASGGRSHELAYDQKYHPIDDFLRPSQAARRRAEHGMDANMDDADSEITVYDDRHRSESSIEIESVMPGTSDRSLTECKGLRRSTRPVNHNVLYNTSVHPQDEELRRMSSGLSNATVDDSVLSHSTVSSFQAINKRKRVELETVPIMHAEEITDDESDQIEDSFAHSTPLSAISIDNAGRRVSIHDSLSPLRDRDFSPARVAEPTPFVIYEEPLYEQLAKEAAAPEPMDFEDDDKENPDDDTASTIDPIDTVTVRPISSAIALNSIDAMYVDYDAETEFHHPASMFDGTYDRFDTADHKAILPVPRDVGLDANSSLVFGNRDFWQRVDPSSVLSPSYLPTQI